MKRNLLVPVVLALAALSLAGCAAGGASESSDAAGPAVESQQATSLESADLDGAAASERAVITTGYITITAEDPLAAASAAIAIVERIGGRVDARSEDAPVDGDAGRATLTLRVPSETLTVTIDELRELGVVEQVSLSSVDVTTEAQDLDARIAATSASLDRLLALLSSADTTETVLALESAITERQGNLESMESQRRLLADQVSLSTLQLTFSSIADAPADEPDTFLSGLLAGWGSLIAFFTGLLVVVGVMLPWLVLVGGITGAVFAVLRWRRARAVAIAGAAAAPPGV